MNSETRADLVYIPGNQETYITAAPDVDGWYWTISGTTQNGQSFASAPDGPYADAQAALDAAYYHLATQRVDADPALQPYRSLIFADHPDRSRHLRWVVNAPEDEIVFWATWRSEPRVS
ncbi:MAG TPA: hypothetical protein VKY74_08715 [Chloroflexia bacterium]|nr:hypothetical protein [Chloroflexia bacterium]